MTKHRQYLLAGLLGLLLLYFGGEWLWKRAIEGPLEERRGTAERLERDITKRDNELSQARKSARQLSKWEAQSLPSNPELARSLYQAWLLGLVEQVGLENPVVEVGEPAGRKGSYKAFGSSVRAQGTLEQLTAFLYEFYRAGHLHQVRSVTMSPVGKEGRLNLSIGVEALILPGATREDRLNPEPSDRLAGKMPADYRIITQRNLFGTGGASDPMEQTLLTSVIYVNGIPEVWFSSRCREKIVKLGQDGSPAPAEGKPGLPNETIKLHPGEGFRIGEFTGKVLRVEEDDVILDSDGRHWLLSIGESLAQAAALPPGL